MMRLMMEQEAVKWEVGSRMDGFVFITRRERLGDGSIDEQQIVFPEELLRAFLKLRE